MRKRTAYSATKVIVHGEAKGRVLDVTLELSCGCSVRRTIAKDRVMDTLDGQTIVVGKYPCDRHLSM